MSNGDNGPTTRDNILNMNVEVGEEEERMQSLIISKEVEEIIPVEQTYTHYHFNL